ncbi:MAG: potassium transporter TrkA, partial [Anaerolineae bacterium]|nr:potassium transporter TrkA [Anaerolineae bacterium]
MPVPLAAHWPIKSIFHEVYNMKRASLRERLQYWFDNTMSKGVAALIAWLAAASLVAIVIISGLLYLFGNDGEASFGEQVWAFVMLTLEPDAVTFAHWTFRLATLAMVFTGIFLTSSLIGLLTTAIEEKFEQLRKGRSRVLESGHSVILGWSEQVFPIIAELAVANHNQRRSSLVVLGHEDKIAMREAVDDQVGDTGRMRVRLRSGDPLLPADLRIASPESAKSIIVLPPQGEHADALVVKTLLALNNHEAMDGVNPCIVAPIHDADNLHAAQIAGNGVAELMLTGTLIARIAAQTCRQSGLSMVYSDLLDFAGDEIYFQHEPALEGKTYGEALLAYRDSAVIGLHRADGGVYLNPPMDTVIAPGEEVIAITEDDDTIRLPVDEQPAVQEEYIESLPKRSPGRDDG